MTNIILLGPPGCGKGTQSKILVEQKGFLQLSTGDLLRKTAALNTVSGREISEIMKKGELVSDDIVITMILEELDKKSTKDFIFDGFPRNLHQAEKLDGAFEDKEIVLDFVIFLDVELNILKERIEKRIEEAGNNNVRQDDNIKTLSKRVETYKNMTVPLLKYYKNKNKLTKINGMDSIESISTKIKSLISN